jgi:hypothetical protein
VSGIHWNNEPKNTYSLKIDTVPQATHIPASFYSGLIFDPQAQLKLST